MVDRADEELLWKIVTETCNDVLHLPWVEPHTPTHTSSSIKSKIVWTDIGASAGSYEEVADMDRLVIAARTCLHDYNSLNPNRAMDLYLFSNSVEHVVRVLRVLRQMQGHALLLGPGGSGRQSLARLAAHIAGHEVYELSATHTPSTEEWREDLKRLLRTAGLQMRPTVSTT